MRIPKHIKFKTRTFQVIYDRELLRDDNSYGRISFAKQKIFLDPTAKREQLELTFIHELIHLIIFSSPLRHDVDRKLDEKITRTIAEDLLVVIKDNKLDLK